MRRRPGVARLACSECGVDIPNNAFLCPDCGSPAREPVGGQKGRDISATGMAILLLVFLVFPVVLVLLHIFVPGM